MVRFHRGLNITDDDWQIAVNDFNASLDKFNVGKRERDELLAALSSLKADIVTEPAR